MTEVSDGARILRRHVDELEYIGEIDEERAERLHDDIDQLQRCIERHYEDEDTN